MRYLNRAAVGLATGLLLLSGCSSLGSLVPGGATSSAPATSPATEATSATTSKGSSGQSATEACAALGSAMSEASTTLSTAVQDMGSDPEKAVKAMTAFQETFTTAIASADNAELKAQAQKALDALSKLIPLIEDGLNDPTKVAEITSALSAFQTEITAIGTICGG